jgi:hypothetical protein
MSRAKSVTFSKFIFGPTCSGTTLERKMGQLTRTFMRVYVDWWVALEGWRKATTVEILVEKYRRIGVGRDPRDPSLRSG